MAIAVVGVAGVLAFAVSARTRKFGIRLALGSATVSGLSRCPRVAIICSGVTILARGQARGGPAARSCPVLVRHVSSFGVHRQSVFQFARLGPAASAGGDQFRANVPIRNTLRHQDFAFPHTLFESKSLRAVERVVLGPLFAAASSSFQGRSPR